MKEPVAEVVVFLLCLFLMMVGTWGATTFRAAGAPLAYVLPAICALLGLWGGGKICHLLLAERRARRAT